MKINSVLLLETKEGGKKVKKIINFSSISIIVLILFFSLTGNTIYAGTNLQEIDIATSPEKVLLDVSNLKPGDWVEKTLTIKNNGKQDFKYLSSIELKEGSEKYYKELSLKISNKENILYDGKMGDFVKLEPRLIRNNASEDLIFKVVIPEELGNDFQGVGSLVEFKFYVEGTMGGLLPVDGPKLPNTGTNMFNIIIAGAALVVTGFILQFVLMLRRKITKHA